MGKYLLACWLLYLGRFFLEANELLTAFLNCARSKTDVSGYKYEFVRTL